MSAEEAAQHYSKGSSGPFAIVSGGVVSNLALVQSLERKAFGTIINPAVAPDMKGHLLAMSPSVFSTHQKQVAWKVASDISANGHDITAEGIVNIMNARGEEPPFESHDFTLTRLDSVVGVQVVGLRSELEVLGQLAETKRLVRRVDGLATAAETELLNGASPDGSMLAIEELLQQSAEAATSNNGLELVSVSEMEVSHPTYLIEGLLPEQTLVGLIGKPGVGKSLCAIAMAVCVATGRDFLGQKVHQPRGVVWLAGEDRQQLAIRQQAFANSLSLSSSEQALLIENFKTLKDDHSIHLSDSMFVRRLITQIRKSPKPVGLIVVDTWAATSDIGDENDNRQVQRTLEVLKAVSVKTGASVVLIHHPKRGGSEPRGASAFDGAVRMLLTLDESNLTVTKYNHGKTGFQLRAGAGVPEGATSDIAIFMAKEDVGNPQEVVLNLFREMEGSPNGELAIKEAQATALRDLHFKRTKFLGIVQELTDANHLIRTRPGFVRLPSEVGE